MRILFVARGGPKEEVSTIVREQGDSLASREVEIDYFIIKGKGILGYLRALPKLRKIIRKGNYDLFHAHYSLSAYTASITGAKPLIVSLMGSEVLGNFWQKPIIKLLIQNRWSACIAKSESIAKSLNYKYIHIIPNGVNLEQFIPMDRSFACKELGWKVDNINLLFPADPQRREKNFELLQKSLELLSDIAKIELHILKDIPHQNTNLYFNASDMMVLTSLWEGSPNVIKEAMACNCPIISTDVGDVKWILGETEGCEIVEADPVSIASSIRTIIQYGKRTEGRTRIQHIKLDIYDIAGNILHLYREILLK